MQSISISKTAGLAAGIAFIGYCIYFDQKRRGAKDFKKKLHEKRQEREKKFKTKGKTSSKLPDLTGEMFTKGLLFYPLCPLITNLNISTKKILDHEAVQRYFLHEIQMGEALISQGDIANGVEHLANAVIVCGKGNVILFYFLQVYNRMTMIFRPTNSAASGPSANFACRGIHSFDTSNARISE